MPLFMLISSHKMVLSQMRSTCKVAVGTRRSDGGRKAARIGDISVPTEQLAHAGTWALHDSVYCACLYLFFCQKSHFSLTASPSGTSGLFPRIKY
jgi:hypothetical protein